VISATPDPIRHEPARAQPGGGPPPTEREAALALEADRLTAAVAALCLERDEADRRAGAAERHLAALQDSAAARASWLTRAKREWGVGDNVSFDRVWAEAKALKAKAADDLLVNHRRDS